MIYHLQTGDQKTQGCDFGWVLKPESQEHQSQEKKDVSAQVIKQDGASSFVFYLGSIQALNGLSDAHPHWGRQSTLLVLPIWMLISSGNNFIDTSKNNVLSNIWAFLSSDKLTQIFKHHSRLSITYKQALGESSDCWMFLYDYIQNKTTEYDSA